MTDNLFSKLRLTVLGTALALAACAGRPVATPPVGVTEVRPVGDHPARPFESGTLYDLMLAEFAADRGRPDVALSRYAAQGKTTQDPNVLERASEIAQFVNAEPQTHDLLEQWAKADPSSVRARYFQVLESLRNQRFDQTIPALDELLRLQPDADIEQLFESAVPPTREGREKLLAALGNLPAKDANSSPVFFARALLQERNGDLKAALANVQSAEKLHPERASAILLDAKLLLALGDDKGAESRLRAATRQQPGNRLLRQNYARVLVHNKKYEAARTEYLTLNAQDPDDGDTLLTLALLALEEHDDATATTQLNRLVDVDQHADEAHYYLASLAHSRKDDPTALAELEKVEPGNVFLAARQDMAEILYANKGLQAARDSLAAARSLASEVSAPLYCMEADLLNRAHQSKTALDLLNQALTLDPHNDQLLYGRGMTAERLDILDTFETDMHTLLERDPNNATVLNALGYTLAERTQRLDEAQGYISRALVLRPDDPAIIDSMGWVTFRKGDTKTALDLLQKAYNLMPDDEIAAHVGEVLWQLGRKSDARKVWAEALARVPDSEFVQKARSRLDHP